MLVVLVFFSGLSFAQNNLGHNGLDDLQVNWKTDCAPRLQESVMANFQEFIATTVSQEPKVTAREIAKPDHPLNKLILSSILERTDHRIMHKLLAIVVPKAIFRVIIHSHPSLENRRNTNGPEVFHRMLQNVEIDGNTTDVDLQLV
jgi:hypothetical protein